MGKKKRIIVAVIIAIILPILLTTKPWERTPTPTPTQLETYSKYGFSFEYPRNFSIVETGVLESEANDTSGLVQAVVSNGEHELFQVGWIKMMPDVIESGPGGLASNLEACIEDGFAGMEATEAIASAEE